MNNIKDLLPIGSVVVLKDSEKALMIIGILPRNGETVRDYVGVLYPEGFISSDMFLVFDHKDIDIVLFRGFYGGTIWDQVLMRAEQVLGESQTQSSTEENSTAKGSTAESNTRENSAAESSTVESNQTAM